MKNFPAEIPASVNSRRCLSYRDLQNFLNSLSSDQLDSFSISIVLQNGERHSVERFSFSEDDGILDEGTPLICLLGSHSVNGELKDG